jgi:hypothetical protein
LLTSNDSQGDKPKGRLDGGLKLIILITDWMIVSECNLKLDNDRGPYKYVEYTKKLVNPAENRNAMTIATENLPFL